MKKLNINLNPTAIFLIIMLTVMISAVIVQAVVYSIKNTNTKSIFDGKICSACGNDATHITHPIDSIRKYYCDNCYDKFYISEYGDIPVVSSPW